MWIRACLAAIVLCLGGCSSKVDPAEAVTGSWKYDTASMKLDLEPAMEAQLKALGAKGEAELKKQADQLKQMLDTMTLVLKDDGTFSISSTLVSGKAATGKWSMDGHKIKAVADEQGQSSPEMELSEDGKRIKATYRQPTFGTASLDLVKLASG